MEQNFIQKNRYYGSLLGLCIGDSMGSSIEYEDLSTRKRIENIEDSQKLYGIRPGVWTDETTLTLCCLESVNHAGFIDKEDILENFKSSYTNGYMTATGEPNDIKEVKQTAEDTSAHLPYTLGSTLCFTDDMETAVSNAIELMAILTTSDTVKSCAAALAIMTCIAMDLPEGIEKENIFEITMLHEFKGDVKQVFEDKVFRKMPFEQFKDCSTSLKALLLAVKCFDETNSFEEGLRLAINTPQQSVTVGTIYGQIAGAHYGLMGINEKWIQQIVNTELIMSVVDSTYERLMIPKFNVASPSPSSEVDSEDSDGVISIPMDKIEPTDEPANITSTKLDTEVPAEVPVEVPTETNDTLIKQVAGAISAVQELDTSTNRAEDDTESNKLLKRIATKLSVAETESTRSNRTNSTIGSRAIRNRYKFNNQVVEVVEEDEEM